MILDDWTKGFGLSWSRQCGSETPIVSDDEAYITSKAVGYHWNIDEHRFHDMNRVGSRSWPSCNAECTAEQRLYRCNAWKEERHTTPNVFRFCETKAKSANSEWKWQRWLVSYTKIWMKLETFANFGTRSASLIFCVSVRETSNLWENTWQLMVHWKQYQDGTRFVVGRWCWVWLRQTRSAVINYLWHILVRFLEVQRIF